NVGANKVYFKANGKEKQVTGKLKNPSLNYGMGTHANFAKDSVLIVMAMDDQDNWSWDIKVQKPRLGEMLLDKKANAKMSFITNLKNLSTNPNAHFQTNYAAYGKIEFTNLGPSVVSGKFSGVLYAPNKDSVKIEHG